MKASGNGTVKQCVTNLLKTWRGEVPYERVKGLDPRMIDKPLATVQPQVQQDAHWLLETYEPRTDVERVTAESADVVSGGILITAHITGGETVSNG